MCTHAIIAVQFCHISECSEIECYVMSVPVVKYSIVFWFNIKIGKGKDDRDFKFPCPTQSCQSASYGPFVPCLSSPSPLTERSPGVIRHQSVMKLILLVEHCFQ